MSPCFFTIVEVLRTQAFLPHGRKLENVNSIKSKDKKMQN